ncbi:MAG: acyl-CoA dehydratase activase-related protein, partial [Leptospirales bacterium]|nr:acyl-CoA dehydratase activase-related protein [Leptospirales bacterium]
NGNKYMFGGRCNKYTNIRKKNSFDESQVYNYIEKRNQLMFTECAPDPDTFVKKKDYKVGIPMAFSVYTLWPLYSWFFHELGIEARQSQTIERDGIARTEGSYCFPAEIAHGAVQSNLNEGMDFIFVPHFRDMPSYEEDIHANFCPITQSLPYCIGKAFLDVQSNVFLMPVVSFKYGFEKALEGFLTMSRQLGVSEAEIRRAFTIANEKQLLFEEKCMEMGRRALEEARAAQRPVMAILGRPYNAFTKDANMGIPLKFTSRGYSVIPFDILPFHDSEIFSNMYWYYGQQDMKATSLITKEDNIFITFITNFSCAPDSFILHYIKWFMGVKPFLILELDSHSADAGVDTRVEAFIDIIDGYRNLKASSEERYDNGLRFINNGKDPLHVMDINENKRIEIFGNKNVKLLLSSMGRLSTELLAASVRSIDINAEAIPVPDIHVLQLARNHMSGKECLPSQLVLGEALAFFSSSKYRKDEIYLLFVPTTRGPCRTGQYFVFYENLFKDMRLENVLVITLDSENSYNELGPQFSKYAWYAMTVADLMKDVETSLRTCAADPVSAMARYDELWQELIGVAERDATKLIPSLASIAKEIAKIPLKRKVKDTAKVLIVGEIFVRRDDFSVDELIRILSKRGIIGKISGVGEWVYYCDFVRHYEIKKRFNLIPFYKRYFSKEFKELINWKIESWWKHRVEKSIKDALAVTELIPDAPHDMNEIMKNAEDYFTSLELQSEITVSSGAASAALLDDYSGVINISPFACLIGRVIEGLVTPWARLRRLPVMSVEIDGEILPPNIVNKLEIFMLNVLRFRSGITNAELVESAEADDVSLDRKLIVN